MADPAHLEELHKQTGLADHPQRVQFRSFLKHHCDIHSMLDCGAGPGWEYDALRADGIDIQYVALEVTKLFVDELKARNISVYHASVERIPLPDHSVDLVYVRQVLEHVGNFPFAIREMIRVARYFVYIAMNKDFGTKSIRRQQYGLWHNQYAKKELLSAAGEHAHQIDELGHKSYLLHLYHES